MNYPRLHPKPVPAPPKRRPTHGNYQPDEYRDDFNDYSQPAFNQSPRRRPVPSPASNNPSSSPDYNAPRPPRRQDSYGSPPVSSSSQSGKFEYKWPQAAQQAASGYSEPKSTLVYPEEFVYTPPPPSTKKKPSYVEDRLSSSEDLYGDMQSKTSRATNDNYRPLPPPPEPSSYLPRHHVSPYQEQFNTTYPNERFHQSPEAFENPWKDHSPRRRSPSSSTPPTHIEMPAPFFDTSDDTDQPLPPAHKLPFSSSTQTPESKSSRNREGSLARPGTRGSTSSIYSYTQDRPIEDDYKNYSGNEFETSPEKSQSDSIGRSETIVPGLRNSSLGTLRLDTDDLPPRPIPPPPPPHVQLPDPESPPQSQTPPASFPQIHRSHTDPNHNHYRSTSSEHLAPTPPPKVPLSEGYLGEPSPAVPVIRSQSHSTGIRPLPRSPARFIGEIAGAEESPITPATDSKTFPISSKRFEQCTEPWSLSALRVWIQSIFGISVSMEDATLALQGLFTHHVSTLSVTHAEKLAAQVGTTWIREGVLFEPTVANTALWNPLSTLEFSFTPVQLEGVIPTLTGQGCYSRTCATTPPGVGRCYSYRCSRTLVKKSGLPAPAALPAPPTKAADWTSFWSVDAETLRTMEKREIKRQNVIFEFIQAEEEYVSDLNIMLNFQKQLIATSTSTTPVISGPNLDLFLNTVFGNIKPILDWQTKKLLNPLRERQAQQGPVIRGLGDIVLEWVRGCSSGYADYAGAYPNADIMVRRETISNPAFAAWLDQIQADPASRRLSFNSFLQAPNRKIQRVLLLFSEIIKNTEETNRDRETLQKATDELKEIVHECDARIAETAGNLARQELDEKLVFKANQKVDLELQEPNRKVLHEGEVTRKSDNRLEWLDVHLILLDNYLIMTKKRRERNVDKLIVSKQPIPVDLLQLEGVTDDAVTKQGKFVGTMTSVVNVAPPPTTGRGKGKLPRASTSGPANQSPDLTYVTNLSSPPADKTLIYPFSVTHLASSGDTYTFYAESATARQTWVEYILEAKNERAWVMSKIEPFEARIIGESVFGSPTTLEQASQKPPALVDFSTMHRALASLRSEPFGARTLGRSITNARVTCAKSFIAPEGTDYAHQRMVAVGTEDGVYLGYIPEVSGLCTTWSKVISLPQTTQMDVLEEFGVFLVLANRELIAYSLASIIPTMAHGRGIINAPPVTRQPQRLSGNHSVGFFATGKLKDRMLVIYKRKSGVTSVFRVLEPVVGKTDMHRKNLFTRKKSQMEFFRDYDDFFVATDCYALYTFKNTISIPTTKGFEVLTLDSKDAPQTIPDLTHPHMAQIASVLNNTKALGMFRISDKEFLLCYEQCAIYVDLYGEISRTKVINWHGKPRAIQVIEGKYVLAFDTSFIEIWQCGGDFGEGGVSLVQIIPGRDIRMIGKEEQKADLGLGPSTGYYDRVYVAMGHPERADRQIVVELVARRF